jgi:transposase
MTKRIRRNFSPEDKVKILKRHLVDRLAVSDVCDAFGIHPNQFYQWQKQFFENGAAAFASERPDPDLRRRNQELEHLRAKLARKDSVIAEISEEYVQLKKELGES